MPINIKNDAQIQAMREGGKILGQILLEVSQDAKPGVALSQLEAKAVSLFKKYNVQPGFKGYHGYPATLCISVNEEVVHTIPGGRILQEGDILSIDGGVLHKGMNTDSAIALVIGKTTPEAQKLVDTCKRALWLGIKQARPGNKVGDISNAIEQEVTRNGFTVIPELTGHGIGKTLHEDPYVPNQGKAGSGPELKPGMTIAIEPIICTGRPEISTLPDGWTIVTSDSSLSIQHEHTILITEGEPEVLTLRPGENPV